MPDWSYQTLFRPLLFRLPFSAARRIALGSMGALARTPGGGRVIDFLGHARPDLDLGCALKCRHLATRVGLGGGLDPEHLATEALVRFGFGFVELGPVTLQPSSTRTVLDRSEQVLRVDGAHEAVSADRAEAWLSAGRSGDLPVVLRFGASRAEPEVGAAWQQAIFRAQANRLLAVVWDAQEVARLTGAERDRWLAAVRQDSGAGGWLVLLSVPASCDRSVSDRVQALVDAGQIDGILIDGTLVTEERRELGRSAFAATCAAAARWRESLGAGPLMLAGGGIHEPRQALQLLAAGADLLLIDSGLVFAGPGLPKRVNEAILYYRNAASDEQPDSPAPAVRQTWVWTGLMGISMLLGGIMALVIAATRVIMPYDESLSGLTRAELVALNPRLLDFMAHDRMTLAGTMLAVGLLYCGLSWFGSRRGISWAHHAIVVSAFTGFFSFFLFLGFGYFDPFHAFVTGILFQFLLLSLRSDLPRPSAQCRPGLTNDWRWQLSNWGQLIFIGHGAALTVAGAVISAIGVSSVFVSDDLEFLRTTADVLHAADADLVPMVAHDRATFGGMLLACGGAVLLSAVWGFRRGHHWHWWSLMLAGNVAYLATIHIHHHVGYTSTNHLLPAYGGLAVLWLGGALTWPYMGTQNIADPGLSRLPKQR